MAVLGDQTAQARFGHEVIARSEEAEQAAERTKWKHLPAPDAAPDLGQLVGCLNRLRTRRDERAIDRADGGADDQVRDDAALIQRAQHADLYRPEARAPGEDERDAIRARTHARLGVTGRSGSYAARPPLDSTPTQSPRKNRPRWRREEQRRPQKSGGPHTCFAEGDTMSVNTLRGPIPSEASALRRTLDRLARIPPTRRSPSCAIGFTVLPIVMGLDKFSNTLVNWENYLAPWIHHLSPLSALHTMHIVGVIEIVSRHRRRDQAPLRRLHRRRMARRHRRQPAQLLGLLRHRAPRLRADARGADARAARLEVRPPRAQLPAPPLGRTRRPRAGTREPRVPAPIGYI